MPEDCFLDICTDDVVAVTVACVQEMAQILLSSVMRTMSQWTEDYVLHLAGEKTEIVIIIRKEILIKPQIGDKKIIKSKLSRLPDT